MIINEEALKALLADEPQALEVLPWAINRLKNRQNRVFAISGKKGSGKDTFATKLVEAVDEQCMMEAFARPLKEEANIMFDSIAILSDVFNPEQIKDILIREHNLTGIKDVDTNMGKLVEAVLGDLANGIFSDSYKRSPGAWATLRLLGTDIRREQDDNYWVKKTLASVVLAVHGGYNVCITDARFPNELDAAMLVDATTIRMVISPEVQKERLFQRDGSMPSEDALMHPSETGLDDRHDFDFFIDNDGEISLEDNVNRVVKDLN